MKADSVLSGERRAALLRGEALEVLAEFPDFSLDSMVTDPPAGISFMGKTWDHNHGGRVGWCAAFAAIFAECLRVLKPGAHVFVWALPRTSHWTVTALEDAGFEIRDVITHHFGTGFPKSLNVGKAIDKVRGDDVRPVCRFLRVAMESKGLRSPEVATHFGFHSRMVDHWAARDTDSQPTVPTWEHWLSLKSFIDFGDEMDAEVWRLNGRKGEPGENWFKREKTGETTKARSTSGKSALPTVGGETVYETWDESTSATDAAKQWDGWGTALKPATEHWILARKPLAGTVAANVAEHGCGALNVDGCRVQSKTGETNPSIARRKSVGRRKGEAGIGSRTAENDEVFAQEHKGESVGRWPPNLLLTHAADCGDECAEGCPVREMDRQSDGIHGAGHAREGGASAVANEYAATSYHVPTPASVMHRFGDSGGASRFFPRFRYQAKASKRERNEGLPEGEKNTHPTVKSVELMRWLCRLVTPPGGVVLDPFMGSGSTGVACAAEGFRFIGVEREVENAQTSAHRISAKLGKEKK